MTLKAKVFHGVSSKDVVNRVASEFRDIVDSARLPYEAFTVMNFPSMRGSSTSIVDSMSLRKAFDKAKAYELRIVVVAHGFTQEALKLIEQEEAIAFFKSDFFWTDESWKIINSMN